MSKDVSSKTISPKGKDIAPLSDPRLLAIATIALFSLGPLVAKLLSIQSEFLLITVSFSFSLITFLIGLFVFKKQRASVLIGKLRPSYFLVGLFGYFLYWQCFIQSLRVFTSASGTTVLNYTWPIFTVIFTELFFRKTSRSKTKSFIQGIGVMFGFAAVITLATQGDFTTLEIPSLAGLCWGLGAGISYGLFSAFSSSVPGEDQLVFLTAAVFASLIAMLPFSFNELHLLSKLQAGDYALMAFLGCVIDGFGYLAWASANRRAKELSIDISSVASLIFFLPVISITILSFVLGEDEIFHPYFLATLALLTTSTILCQRSTFFANLIGGKSKDL